MGISVFTHKCKEVREKKNLMFLYFLYQWMLLVFCFVWVCFMLLCRICFIFPSVCSQMRKHGLATKTKHHFVVESVKEAITVPGEKFLESRRGEIFDLFTETRENVHRQTLILGPTRTLKTTLICTIKHPQNSLLFHPPFIFYSLTLLNKHRLLSFSMYTHIYNTH